MVVVQYLFNLIFLFMSQSVLSKPKVVSSHSRHAFDNSCFRNYHQSLGQIVPVYCKAFPAGTKGSFNRFTFTRSKKVIYPAFQGVHECFDVFKVPLRLLWTKWNDFKLNVNDINSSSLVTFSAGSPQLSLEGMCPRFDFGSNSFAKLNDQQGLVAMTPQDINEGLRLLDSLRYGQTTIFNLAPNTMSLFKLAAYQKVYYDHYRNTAYESNDPYAYNLDHSLRFDTPGLFAIDDNLPAAHSIKEMLTLRYVNMRNDAMHNIYPSLNYVISTPTGSNWSLPSSVVGASYSYTAGSQSIVTSVGSTTGSGWTVNQPNMQSDSTSDGGGHVYANFSPQTIRSMFALDKLMRASAYAPKHIKDQFKARFGVDLPDSVQYHSDRLGSYRSEVVFGEVTSTANTSDTGSNLGDVSGKGVGSGDWEKPINFYCEEDSIILAVHYFTYDPMYDSTSVDEWNTKLAREDFFQPEFENLGLRPFYAKFLDNTGDLASQNRILGYTVPNQNYKIEPDMNTGIFNNTFKQVTATGTVVETSSPLRAFVSHTNLQILQNPGSTNGVNKWFFKVRPEILNTIFEESYSPWDFNTDQFYGHCKFRVPTVMPMSVHGQPSL